MRPIGPVVAAGAAAALLAACAPEGTPETGASPAPSVTTPAPPTGPATAPTGTGSTTAPATPPAAPDVQQITVAIAGGKVTPAASRIAVPKGKKVRITVSTTDAPDEIHVHGFDKEAPVKPGTPAVVEFVADQAGLFEVETHETEKVLFFLQVR